MRIVYCVKRATMIILIVVTILLMKKKHPCGGEEFTVTRSGMDFKLVCRTCGREIMIPRAKAERHIKRITHPEEQ